MKIELDGWIELEVEPGCGCREMKEERISTAGDALLMGSAINCC
jgi:hypothetical protein